LGLSCSFKIRPLIEQKGGQVARDLDFGLEGTVWQPLEFFLALVASLLLPSIKVGEEAAPDITASTAAGPAVCIHTGVNLMKDHEV
jgi:hypothetical protein